MATKIDLIGLKNFQKKVQNLQNDIDDYVDRILTAILEKGVQLAQQEYAGIPEIICYYEKENGKGKIVAKDTRTTDASQPNSAQIAYLEFGYGVEGAGTYDGKLPTSDIDLTKSWTYYYDSIYKATESGQKGWWTKLAYDDGQAHFVTGQPAGNHMYKVFKQLKEYATDLLKDYND